MTIHAKSRLRYIARSIFGGFVDYEDVSLTNSVSTSDWLDVRGIAFGKVYNETGGSITLTYYTAKKKDATPRLSKDQDGVGISQTIGDGEAWDIPVGAVAGSSFLVPVLSSGTASGPDIWFHFER